MKIRPPGTSSGSGTGSVSGTGSGTQGMRLVRADENPPASLRLVRADENPPARYRYRARIRDRGACGLYGRMKIRPLQGPSPARTAHRKTGAASPGAGAGSRKHPNPHPFAPPVRTRALQLVRAISRSGRPIHIGGAPRSFHCGPTADSIQRPHSVSGPRTALGGSGCPANAAPANRNPCHRHSLVCRRADSASFFPGRYPSVPQNKKLTFFLPASISQIG